VPSRATRSRAEIRTTRFDRTLGRGCDCLRRTKTCCLQILGCLIFAATTLCGYGLGLNVLMGRETTWSSCLFCHPALRSGSSDSLVSLFVSNRFLLLGNPRPLSRIVDTTSRREGTPAGPCRLASLRWQFGDGPTWRRCLDTGKGDDDPCQLTLWAWGVSPMSPSTSLATGAMPFDRPLASEMILTV
jgi:hypothetical protein